MRKSPTGNEPLPLMTESEVRGLVWGGHTYGLINLETRDLYDFDIHIHLRMGLGYGEPGYIRLLTKLKEINSQPNHPLCNKLQLIANPFI
jgi:hypothetical protein